MRQFIKSLRILPRWIIILIDLGIIAGSALIGFALRFNFNLSEFPATFKGLTLYMIAGMLAIFITQSYAGIIRYTSIQDGIRVLYATLLTAIFVSLINLIHHSLFVGYVMPFQVVIIAFFTSSVLLFSYRLLIKFIFRRYTNILPQSANVLIYGAGSLGQLTNQVIDHHAFSRFKVAGFLEDDPNKIGKTMGGVKIYNANGDINALIHKLKIQEFIIAISDLSLKKKNAIVDICLANNIIVRQVPPAERWVRGELSLRQIKEIKIEDLLGRETIKLNNIQVRNDIFNKTVLITGAAGSIGSELVRQIAVYRPRKLILVDQSESGIYDIENEIRTTTQFMDIKSYIADIINFQRMDQIFEESHPDMVFHAAAYKHVPLMEHNASEAVLCNVFGTKNLADLAIKYDIDKFVMISTDKAVNPTNLMGATKRLAEIYVQSLGYHIQNTESRTRFITTRFGNVLGSNGSVIPLFKKQISMGGPITVTHPDVTRYFMTIPEACELVLEAAVMGKGNEIFIFDMGEPVRIVELAKKMIRLSGLEEGKDIYIKFVGLREGEKLFEELLNDEENTIPTHHNKIMIANVRVYKYREVSEKMERIVALADGRNDLEMVSLIKKMIPEYRSNYSRYQVLDSTE